MAARVVGTAEADDVSQDALLRAYHRLDSFRGEGSFRSWLLRIVHNTALNHLQRRVPEPVGGSDDIEQTVPATEGSREPVSRLERRERAERLELKLRNLRPEHRSVLVLRDLEGMAYDEIALITDSPLGSVKGRLHRARNELIEILRSNTYDGRCLMNDEPEAGPAERRLDEHLALLRDSPPSPARRSCRAWCAPPAGRACCAPLCGWWR